MIDLWNPLCFRGFLFVQIKGGSTETFVHASPFRKAVHATEGGHAYSRNRSEKYMLTVAAMNCGKSKSFFDKRHTLLTEIFYTLYMYRSG